MAGRRIAFLMGSSEFGDNAELKDLRCPPQDVDGLAEVLRDPECGGFERVEKVVNVEHGQVAFRLNQMLLEAETDDLVVIYYSGHGKLNRRGFLHLAMPDTVVANVETTSLPIVDLRNYTDNCNAQRIVLILDCCYSGRVGDAFMKSSVGDTLQTTFDSPGRGIYIISASTGIESAVEKDGDRYSVFTQPLIDGLSSGKADVDHSGWIEMDELYGYVLSEVRKAGKQTPMRWNLGAVDKIVIARNASADQRPASADRWNALLTVGLEGGLPREVLVDALDFLGGRRQPFDVDRAGELIDALVHGGIDAAEFAREWSKAAEADGLHAQPPLRVLAVDGGGVRVILAARVLKELEQRAARPARELFDVMAGTSFGGLLAAALCARKDGPEPLGADEFLARFEERAPEIFTRKSALRQLATGRALRPRYKREPLREFAEELFGGAHLADVEDAELFMSAYEIQRQAPFYFRSRLAHKDAANDFRLSEVVLAATALPGLFPPVGLEGGDGSRYALIDGSLVASNPALAVYAEAKRMRPDPSDPLLLSLGTGDVTRPIQLADAEHWGVLQWATPMFDIAMQGAGSQVDEQLRLLSRSDHYLRIEHVLRSASDPLTDPSPDNLRRLNDDADQTIELFDAELDTWAARLAAGAPAQA